MLNPLKNVMTVEMVRCLIAKIKGALATKVSMDDVVSSWQSTPDDAHVPTEKLVKDTLDNLPPGTAVKGDAESEYRTGNVNLTPANIGAYSKTESDSRYKAVQNPVSDPAASGSGLSFIDSVTQNANGEITPHKKTVQDGTTAQKGVVQLNNAINSTSTTEAATPKAVKDAYDELNSKIVARAVFLSQQEWAAQSQLPGDPAKVYYVEDGTGEDAYTVYVWKESTSEYVEVDESSIDLDGYWHDGPTTTGNGNVVTGITLGNDGVPVIEKGITALTQHQDISGKLDRADVGVANGAASLDSNGDVPLEQIPDSVKDKIVYIDGTATLNTSTGVFALTVPNTTFATISTVVNEGKLPVLRVTVNNGKSYLKLYYKGLMSDNSDNHWHSFGSTDNQVNSPCTTDAKVFDNDEWRMTENLALNYKGNGNDVTVTPDGTSSGTDIGNSTTLKEWAQKFKNLVTSLTTYVQKSQTSGLLKNDGTVDTSDYLTKTGDASNTTAPFTKAGGDASSMASGDKLSAIFTAISSFFASLKALAYKDTVGTSDIADDAITAAKVKDNETLPVNISGNAATATNLAAGGTSGQYLKSNGSGNAPSWDNTSNLNVGRANKLNYLNTNEINFTNVPSRNYNSHYFNHVNGDTGSADSSKKITDYYFEDRNASSENVILHTGGITNRQYNSGYGGDGYDVNLPNCSRCIRFTLNSSNSTFAIRCLLKTGGSSINGGFVDLFIKTATDNNWDCTCFVSRSKMSSSDMGNVYYHQIGNTVYIVIKVGAYGNNCTPILLSKDGTVNVEFGDYSSVFKNYPSSNPLSSYINVYAPINSKVGSTTIPVYVDTDGSVKQCTNVNADTVDGKHIVVGTLGSAANTIYFLDGT